MSTKMTPKRFVASKLSGKISAEGFLAAHWEFLQGQSYLAPILEAYENKEVLPTPTVQMCQAAVLSHILELEARKGTPKVKTENGNATKIIRRKKSEGNEVDESEVPKGRYQVTLMCKFYSRDGSCKVDIGLVEKTRTIEDSNGVRTVTETEPAIFHADTFQAASRMADRKLVDRGDSVYAIIVNTHDRPIATHIQRDDAIARLMSPAKGPSVVRTGASTSTLGFGIKAKNDRSHFSRG